MSRPEPDQGLVPAALREKADGQPKSSQGRWATAGPLLSQADLVLSVVAALLLLPLALLTTGFPRSVLGLLLALFLPGYIATVVAFPGQRQLEMPERFAYSFGLSIAITLLVGLVLTYTPLGLRLDPVLASLAAVVIAGSAAAFLRRRHLSSIADDSMSGQALPHDALGAAASTGRLSLVLALAFVAVVVTVIAAQPALNASATRPSQQLTEFYLVDTSGKLGDAQHQVVAGQKASVRLGLHNLAGAPANYRIVATIDGKTVGETAPIPLQAGERWQGVLTYQPVTNSPRQLVRFQLYQGATADPDQYLLLWIDVTAGR